MSSSSGPNTILVEKHYIPVDVYMQMYHRIENTMGIHPTTSVASNFERTYTSPTTTTASRYSYAPSSAETSTHTRNRYSADTATQRPASSSTSRPADRTNDLLSFFNLQPTRNTDNLTSRFFTRTYDYNTSTEPDSSFVNLLMTTFLTAPNNTSSSGTTARITPLLLEANSRIFTYTGNIDLDSATCSICTQEWQHGEELRKLSVCRHYFHKSCVDTWLREHDTCPLCRTNIVSSNVNPTGTTNNYTTTGVNEVD
jgi:hypothetical protein